VPLWALDQSNSVSDRATLSEGQRVVVPRHLVPMAMPNTATNPVTSAISSYAPAGQ
jgi:hypothetical protein